MLRVITTLLLVLFSILVAHAQNNAEPVTMLLKQCENELFALEDRSGKQHTDCKYLDIYKKSENYYLARIDKESIVLLDRTGKQIPKGVFTTNKDLSKIPFRDYGGNKLEINNHTYLHFYEQQILEGPFLNEQRGHMSRRFSRNRFWNSKHQIKTLDSILVMYDTLGQQIKLERLKNIKTISEKFYVGESSDGLLQVWSFDGVLKFEGNYDTVRKENFGYRLQGLDEHNETTYAYLDENADLMIGNINYISSFSFLLYPNYKPTFYATKSGQDYSLLDSLFNPILIYKNRRVFTYFSDLFSIQDIGAETITLYKGDTTNVLLKNIEAWSELGAKLNLVRLNEKYYFYDDLYQPINHIAYDTIFTRYSKDRVRSFQYIKDGEIGLIDTLLQPIWSIKGDTVFEVKNNNYQSTRDSLFSFRIGQQYGVFDLTTQEVLEIKSDQPIVISKCPDIAIYGSKNKYGLYHFPSQKTMPAIYDRISVNKLIGISKCFDYKILASYANNQTDFLFTNGRDLIAEKNLDYKKMDCQESFWIKREDRQQTLVSRESSRPILSFPGKKLRTILHEDGTLAFLHNIEEEGLVYYNEKYDKVTPQGANWKNENLSYKTPLPYLIVKQKTRRITPQDIKTMKELGKNRVLNGTTGIFDLEKKIYTLPMKYDQVRTIAEGLVSVSIFPKVALANLDGEFLTDFIFSSIGDFNGQYAIAKTLDNQSMIINVKGENPFNQTFTKAKQISLDQANEKNVILFSVVENNEPKAGKIIDLNGNTVLSLPSDMIYKILPGPLDVIEEQKLFTVTKSILVKDMTNEEIFTANEIIEFQQGESSYYFAITDDAYYIINKEGKTLVTLPFDSSYKKYWHGLIDDFHPNYFCISSPIVNSDRTVTIFKLDGELLVEDADVVERNSFGQLVVRKDDKTYLLPPID